MKKYFFIFIFIFFIPGNVDAATISQRLSGSILLDVEGHGEAWYLNPGDLKRYYLGRPNDAFSVMRNLGLGVSEVNFQKIAQAGMPIDGDVELAKKLSGKIILQTEKNGEAWYIYPKDLKKYYLGRPADAFEIMRKLSIGIKKEDLAYIHKPGLEESIDQYSRYKRETVQFGSVNFTVDSIEIDLSDPSLKIITDTADDFNCKSNCSARTLASFVVENNGFAGINGSYFCSSSGCVRNYYFFPVYNSTTGKMINEDQLKYWTTGPLFVFDQNNKFYYFKDSREFKSVADFEKNYGVKLQAAIGNKPRLIEDYMNYLIDWEVDASQRDVKALRNAIAYKNNKIYIIVAKSATIAELAEILKVMGMEYALNLDGGYSAALIYNGEYMVGPGRNIPNAIIFSKKKND